MLSHAEFMEHAELHYAQAWAFVHFRHGEEEQAAELDRRLWHELSGRTDALTATTRAMEGLDLARIEAGFHAHVAALLAAPR